MTPAVETLKRSKNQYRLHHYDHDPEWGSYGEEAAVKMGVSPECVYKTLLAEMSDSRLVVSIVPVTSMLDLKALAKLCKAKKAKMADRNKVETQTGYVIGGVSPLGQKKRLKTIIDASAKTMSTMYISGGKRGLDIELAPNVLAELTTADFAPISK